MHHNHFFHQLFFSHFYHQPEIYQKYEIEGVGKDKICEILDFSVVDEVLQFSDAEAYEAGRDFAKAEGFLLGGSSGGALAVCKKLIKKLPENKPCNIVVIAPDSGFKYLSKIM